jgi:hypothetical protein
MKLLSCEHGEWNDLTGHNGYCMICYPGGYPPHKKAKEMTDHVAATVEALEKIIAMLRAGHSPEDLGEAVVLLGRLMARRT